MDDVLDGRLTSPPEVIEQMTYLMFIHDLDASDTERVKASSREEAYQIYKLSLQIIILKWCV